MAFEKWSRRIRPSPSNPMVSLMKAGIIGLNSTTLRLYVKDAKFGILYFDKDMQRIGIELKKSHDPDAYPIKINKKGSHGTISGFSFMKYNEIYPTETRAFPATWNSKTNIIEVNLKAGKRVRSRKQ